MLPSAIRHQLTLAATFTLLLTFTLPIATQAQSIISVKLSHSTGSPVPSITATSSSLVNRSAGKGSPNPSASATNLTITSTSGWQQTPLTVQQGEQITISYISGTWTVDVNNFPYVDPN